MLRHIFIPRHHPGLLTWATGCSLAGSEHLSSKSRMASNPKPTASTRLTRALLSCGLIWAFATGAAAQQQASAPYAYQVELAQHRLVKLGYRLGTIDGRLGKQTVEALREFQQDQALPTTGRPNMKTLEALEHAAPGPIHPTKLTTQGLVGYINQGTGKCHQENPAAILPNRMARGLRVELREDTLTLKTSYEVTPYEESQDLLRAVKHGRRYRIVAGTVDIDSITVEPVDDNAMARCYRLRMSCLEGEGCITEGYASQREAVSAVFAVTSLEGPVLDRIWHRLLSRLGAGKTPTPEQPAAELTAEPAPDPEPGSAQPTDE